MTSFLVIGLTIALSWTLLLQQAVVSAGDDSDCTCARVGELEGQLEDEKRYIATFCTRTEPPTTPSPYRAQDGDDDGGSKHKDCSCARVDDLESELDGKKRFIARYCPRGKPTTTKPTTTTPDRGDDGDDDADDQPAKLKCPTGYEALDQADNYCYKIISQRMGWTDGQARCKRDNPRAHLAYVTSTYQNSAIVAYLLSNKKATSACNVPGTQYYSYSTCGQLIDSKDCGKVNKDFLWKVSSTKTIPVVYSYWRSTEPNCYFDLPEKCIQYRCETDSQDQQDCFWNDYVCASEVCPICQLEM